MVQRKKGPYHTSAIAIELAKMEGPDRTLQDEKDFRQKYRVRDCVCRIVCAGLCVQDCVCRIVCAGLCVQDCVCRVVCAGLCVQIVCAGLCATVSCRLGTLHNYPADLVRCMILPTWYAA